MHGDLASTRDSTQTPGQLTDQRVLMSAHLIQVDLRLGEGDPEFRGMLGFANHFSNMQQCLGGDTAFI